jgi:uncharacterized protein YhdP
MSVAAAVECVSSRRSCVHFSDAILRQLHEFELLQKSRVSVAACDASSAPANSRKRNDPSAHFLQPPPSPSHQALSP